MQIALTTHGRQTATPGNRAKCPQCNQDVLAKCGEVLTWHWAHINTTDCDPWAEGESAWHAEWKTAAPPDRREVTIGHHRADLIAGDGTVCELQHSSISGPEITERETFYGTMRWLFDATDKTFTIEPADDDWSPWQGWWTVRREHAWPTIGLCQRRVMLDLGPPGVFSCEKINRTGSWARGFLYPRATIRRWIAGPGTLPLDRIRTTPLGQLTPAQVDPHVTRLVQTHTQQALPTAKFSSFV